MMDQAELTMTDVLHDPMIRQLLRADRISLPTFAVLLHNAAGRHQQNTYLLERRAAQPAKRRPAGDCLGF
jgi:hypothetical protein